MRCALIEYNDYHDEVLPSLVHLLNELGVIPDVFMVRSAIARNAFEFAPELRWRRHDLDGVAAKLVKTVTRYRRYDLVIIASLEPKALINAAKEIRRPTLAVLHNADLLLDDADYRSYFSATGRKPFVLGRHISAYLGAQGYPTGWASFVYFGVVPVSTRAGMSVEFGVPGNLQEARRNYGSLLDALDQLRMEGREFHVRMIGRSDNHDGDRFRSALEQRGMTTVVSFEPQATHGGYFREIRRCDFLLPLVDESSPTYRPYYTVKVASAVYMSLGLGIPLVAESALAATYGVLPGAVTYENGGLAGAMRTAMSMSQSDRHVLSVALDEIRTRSVAGSLESLAASIGAVTQGSPPPAPIPD